MYVLLCNGPGNGYDALIGALDLGDEFEAYGATYVLTQWPPVFAGGRGELVGIEKSVLDNSEPT